MITIHKFLVAVEDYPTIMMDPTARVVAVEQRSGLMLNLWAIVNTEHAEEPRKFAIHGTGHPIADGEVYIGTAPGMTGLVWHLFEVES